VSLAPRVAVVIPCRNDAPFLDECLRALEAQDRRADRVIVVDNASTDGSADVARAHGAEVVPESRIGVWPAAAHGYDEAARDADIIARLDADSRPHADWISRIVRDFIADPGMGALTGAAEFYGAGRLKSYLGAKWYIGGMYFWVTPWLGHPPVFGSNFAMRSSLWLRVRDVVDRGNPGIHDDLDLSIRLRPSDGVRYDPELRMPISARPFATGAALWRRVGKVVPTFAVSWPEGAAWNRDRPAQGDTGDEWAIGELGR
jgi:glycosyltransferase involved in cell wall biosynthesis